MRCYGFIIICLIPILAFATNPDQENFESLFKNWTHAFNHKDIKNSCALFSKELTAQYRGQPTKNYDSVCEGFKKVFAETNKTYHYDFELHDVYRDKRFAAVRITWYLIVRENGKEIAKTQDEGLDVLQLNKQGKWEIVNYLGYEV